MMTGRELVSYILENGLEQEIFSLRLDYITIQQAAKNMEVGESTVRFWYNMGAIDGITVNGQIYISPCAMPPSLGDLIHCGLNNNRKFFR